jgi:hypothetical protein
MQRLSILALVLSCGWSSFARADVAPLEADGLRSVLIRGRVVAPLIPTPPTVEVELPVTFDQPAPLAPVIGGPEPTPAIPRPGMVIPPSHPDVRPGPGVPPRGVKTAGADRGDGNNADTKGRDENNRPRLGIFRRRR